MKIVRSLVVLIILFISVQITFYHALINLCLGYGLLCPIKTIQQLKNSVAPGYSTTEPLAGATQKGCQSPTGLNL